MGVWDKTYPDLRGFLADDPSDTVAESVPGTTVQTSTVPGLTPSRSATIFGTVVRTESDASRVRVTLVANESSSPLKIGAPGSTLVAGRILGYLLGNHHIR